jgi:ribosomal RNA-processing protein 8
MRGERRTAQRRALFKERGLGGGGGGEGTSSELGTRRLAKHTCPIGVASKGCRSTRPKGARKSLPKKSLYAHRLSDCRHCLGNMFAVQGWNLGEIVAQTAPKKKLKRKRGEDGVVEGKDIKPRTNPFAMRSMGSEGDNKNSRGSMGKADGIPKKKKKKSKQPEPTEDTGKPEPQVSPLQSAKPEKHKEHKEHKKPSTLAGPSEPLHDQTNSANTSSTSPESGAEAKLTPLQQKMRAKLSGSQFRHINEKLYTTHSNEALTLFTQQPSLFTDYHEGFRHQVQSWPTNPIDIFISRLSKPDKKVVVADLGCGDAALARAFKGNKKVKVHSYDLVKVNELVEVADMSRVPLADGSVDVAVFCLSLMGTNFLSFIREACRYTKLGYPPEQTPYFVGGY